MINFIEYSYDKSTVSQINEWGYGKNWPVVYIIYNNENAYVGETLDACRRTEQHLKEPEFSLFDRICLISSMTFNKSVVLDLESFLIKYISADGLRILTNGNAGVVDHNYFYKEAYLEDFKEIWRILQEKGVVQKSLIDIENSELFKYSPYKTLNYEQQKAAYEILKRLNQINNAKEKSLIQVSGGAGTGKTILAVYLLKLLVDISANKKVWNVVENSEDSIFLQSISTDLSGIKKVGLVVPMIELRNTMKSIFRSIEGLSDKYVLSPEEVVKDYYDVLVVDEAHRLYRRKNLPGAYLYKKFDNINKELMSEKFSESENDLTELDWIIRSSRTQILFYDEYQTIRATDIGAERFKEICRPHLYKYIELFSQMRCKGGNGYYEYIRDIIEKSGLGIKDYRQINGYEFKVVDSIEKLFSIIKSKNSCEKLCKIVTGPGWGKEEKIEIEGEKYAWASGKEDKRDNVIFSVHKIQGFDLNYAGVIFGKEIYYDENTKRIEINKKELKDNFTKCSGDEDMRRFLLNIYITLLTRGISGTYVYAVDYRLREYFKIFFG